MSFIYKIAETPSEFEQIHELNYRTFAEEIPQHERNEQQKIVDKFHDENTYIICLKGEHVVGMCALRGERPFSLDGKIGEVENHLPIQITSPVEVRLLAIDPKYRNGRTFLGLMQALVRYCLKVGYDAALISGTTREQKLYGQFGFLPFAHLTGTEEATFQPMYLTKETFEAGIAGRLSKPYVNLLPGPTTISNEVRTAMMGEPFSHRSVEFESKMERVKNKLTALTGSKHVQLLQGTGTLANDVVAAQLSLIEGKGLILVNGEFGLRLTDHAKRFGMKFDVIETEWGGIFDEKSIIEAVQTDHYTWLWTVHSETSTGVLNDIDLLKKVCSEHGISLALDCVSAIGTVPTDLAGVKFASGVSGKGLASYTGLSFVFHNEIVTQSDRLPRYLDLGAYMEAGGIPYSQSSNLVSALDVALLKYDHPGEVFKAIEVRAHKVRSVVESMGIKILIPEESATPAILTLLMPGGLSAMQLGDNLFLNNFTVHYESAYLRERNWLQIACMNDVPEKELNRMLDVLRRLVTANRQVFTNSSQGY
ncbi:aminotransferase class V-fold PLP-dependent enzyme [Sporosarcina limicola]|uniref:Aspartate aminotransferase-like enzyme/N-acetylglutamate synthase-like GNAT family acetyltransferase n=1 Tax=Sporosarcina limicola TaxID=34101 RepID=A0A927R4U4_9BACL|nr:aminotransferase class V-fold PLP-dependent enzyme [Sporosarcina limicola]MBE1553244.1 aspartate aminotransferase-like enzyme/N-acetylglutamate synthase-like GNAT family acetyltransferase [Sporosarcina limicola]